MKNGFKRCANLIVFGVILLAVAISCAPECDGPGFYTPIHPDLKGFFLFEEPSRIFYNEEKDISDTVIRSNYFDVLAFDEGGARNCSSYNELKYNLNSRLFPTDLEVEGNSATFNSHFLDFKLSGQGSGNVGFETIDQELSVVSKSIDVSLDSAQFGSFKNQLVLQIRKSSLEFQVMIGQKNGVIGYVIKNDTFIYKL